MIVNQVYVADMLAFESECDAPVAGNADGPMAEHISLQGVKPVAGQGQVLRAFGYFEAGEDAFYFRGVSGWRPPTVSFLVEEF